MQLVNLAVQDLRAFREGSISLPKTGIALLVGANNTGKSALLSGLDIVAGVAQFEAVRHSAAEDPARVTVRFALDDDERRELLEPTAGFADRWLRSKAFTEASFTYSQMVNSEEMRLSAVRARDTAGKMQRLAVLHFRPATGNYDWQAVTFREGLRDAEPGRELTFSASGSGVDLAGGAAEHIQPLMRLLDEWRSRYYHFRALRTGTERRRGLNSTDRLDPTGVNLPEVLLHSNTNSIPVWRQIRDVAADVLPEVGELQTPTSGTQVSVEFQDPHLGVTRNIKDLGTGVEQLLMTAYIGLTQPSGSVVVIEEPETNLHPGAQRQLLQHLRDWGHERLFLVSTHSSVFLDFGAHDLPVYLVERDRGQSTVRHIEPEALADALDALGIRASDILSADRILVVEGDTDASIVRTWFPEELQRVAITPGRRGGDLAWQMESIDSVLDAANRLKTQLRFLRDRDELDDVAVDRLTQSGIVHVLRRREIENYLLDADAIHRVTVERLTEARRQLPAEYTAESVGTAMRAAADELKTVVILKRVAFGIKPLRLVDRADLRRLVTEGPSRERLLNHVSDRLPSGGIAAEIGAAWDRTAEEVDAAWEQQWKELAPGTDVLERLFGNVGLAYNKGADGQRLAATLEPPEELREVIDQLLRRQEN